mgnify:CR=1 FL=1
MINKKVVTLKNGKEAVIELLATFSIETKNKNYIVYTVNDDESSDTVNILISEYQEENGNMKIVEIPEEEKSMVIDCYNALKNSI